MFKLLFFIGIIALIYFWFFAKRKAFPSPKNTKTMEEAMISCDACGVYVQAKETLMSSGKHYCSRECLEKRS